MDEPTIAQQIAVSADLLKQYRQHKNRGPGSEHVAQIRAAGHVWFTLARTCSAVPVSNFELVQTFGRKGGQTRKAPVVRVRWLAVQLMRFQGFSFPEIGIVLHQVHTSAMLAFHRYHNQPMPEWATIAIQRAGRALKAVSSDGATGGTAGSDKVENCRCRRIDHTSRTVSTWLEFATRACTARAGSGGTSGRGSWVATRCA